MEIVWKNPSDLGNKGKKNEARDQEFEVARTLRATPNVWAAVDAYEIRTTVTGKPIYPAGTVAFAINNSKRQAFRHTSAGYFEAKSRTEYGKNVLYIRYVTN